MSMKSIYPLNPNLYRKAGVCRSIPIFLIFVPTVLSLSGVDFRPDLDKPVQKI